MYFTAIFIDDEKLSSTELLVWYTLCSFARWKYEGKQPRKADNVFPSQDTIAERAHLSSRAVQKALKHLQELGYIEIESGGNQGRSNRYVLKGENKVQGGANKVQGGANDVRTNNNTINRTYNKGANAEKEKDYDPDNKPLNMMTPEEREAFAAMVKESMKRKERMGSFHG